jgi:hypothetical protein
MPNAAKAPRRQLVWQNIKPIFGFAYRPIFMVSTIYFNNNKKIIYNAQTMFGKCYEKKNQNPIFMAPRLA